jgi:hypothetical protein
MDRVIRQDVAELKTGVAANTAAISVLDWKVTSSDAKVAGVDAKVADLGAMTTDLQGMTRRVILTLVRLEGKMDDMAERMATKEDLKVIKAQLDDFTGDILAARRDRALQSESFMAGQRRLDDHELRIARLETEPRKS